MLFFFVLLPLLVSSTITAQSFPALPASLVMPSPAVIGGTPPDSPGNRVDLNSNTSLFGGVVSIFAASSPGSSSGFLCSGSAISSSHILTAAHCFDNSVDGAADQNPQDNQVVLNFGSSLSDIYQNNDIASVTLHPDFTGFSNPSVNDDLAIITLNRELPEGLPIYSLFTSELDVGGSLSPFVNEGNGESITLVGYGRSGSPISGYTGSANFSTKRVGQNAVDGLFGQDDPLPPANEIFLYDMDNLTDDGLMGGGTLGNEVETIIGPGDSGGPAFVFVGGQYQIAGVNTFTGGLGAADAPFYGSTGGGIALFPYLDWISSTAGISLSTPEPGSYLLFSLLLLPLLRCKSRKMQKLL